MLRRAYKPLKIMKSVLDVCSVPATKVRENQSEMDGRTHTNNSPQQDTHGHHWVSARAMSAHFFTSLHPCFTESDTCDGVGKQGLVRHSQSPLRPVFESHDSQYIDRKTRRSPCRWSHSLTLPRAPRTVRTAFYMTCYMTPGVTSTSRVQVYTGFLGPHLRAGKVCILCKCSLGNTLYTKENTFCKINQLYRENEKAVGA